MIIAIVFGALMVILVFDLVRFLRDVAFGYNSTTHDLVTPQQQQPIPTPNQEQKKKAD